MPSSSPHTCYFGKCCFCIDLKTGCFILAYLNMIGSVLGVTLGAVGLGAVVSLIKNNPEVRGGSLAMGVTVVMLMFLILSLVFSIVLLVGLHKHKPAHVQAFLLFNSIFVGILAFFLVISIIVGKVDILTILLRIVQIAVSAYYLLVIRSYYLDMKEDQTQKV